MSALHGASAALLLALLLALRVHASQPSHLQVGRAHFEHFGFVRPSNRLLHLPVVESHVPLSLHRVHPVQAQMLDMSTSRTP